METFLKNVVFRGLQSVVDICGRRTKSEMNSLATRQRVVTIESADLPLPFLLLYAYQPLAQPKLWIIKLSQQPPMFTASLAKMFVGVLPIALLMHMSTTTYMLGNADILKIGFVR